LYYIIEKKMSMLHVFVKHFKTKCFKRNISNANIVYRAKSYSFLNGREVVDVYAIQRSKTYKGSDLWLIFAAGDTVVGLTGLGVLWPETKTNFRSCRKWRAAPDRNNWIRTRLLIYCSLSVCLFVCFFMFPAIKSRDIGELTSFDSFNFNFVFFSTVACIIWF